MARYFTADLHLGHTNIIKYCGRPFRDADDMAVALIERWNETVGDDDEVVVLGDFAMGKIVNILPLVGLMNGRKVLLAGNHDNCWSGHRKGVEAATTRYLEAGFAEIWQGAVRLDLGEREVFACHFPYRGDTHENDRYVAHRPPDRGAWLLHGHVHELWKKQDRMINVGVDVWDFRPVAEDRLVDLISGS
ncbi:MAG: hypothetical protein ACRDRT_07400 [Pseudonocardiaceae bacterium]